MISFRCLALAILFLNVVDRAISDEPCYGLLKDIWDEESAFASLDSPLSLDSPQKRTYTLCENTVYEPGKINEAGILEEFGDTPLTIYRNAHVKCGPDGSSTNNCTITGSGTYGIFVVDITNWGIKGLGNLIFEGITISLFEQNRQFPVVVGGESGDITFKDCVFENILADPIFSLHEHDFSFPRTRSLSTPAGTSNFIYPASGRWDGRPHRNLISTHSNQIADKSSIKWTFQGCKFRNIVPVENPKSDAGRFILAFRTTDPLGLVSSRPTSSDVKLFDNKFFNNKNVRAQTKFSSMISYNGTGELHMENNCFEKSRADQLGVVLTQHDSEVISKNNYIDVVQLKLDCPFIAKVYRNYSLSACGEEAQIAQCGAVPVVPIACFPGDATSQVEGVGEVKLKNLKLGDIVLTGNGYYQPIYSFGHRNSNSEIEYLKIITKSSEIIMSRDHMIFLDGGRSVPAGHVKIGDKLVATDDETSTVLDFKNVRAQGAFAPFTASGTIVVNGFKASSFVSFQNSGTLLLSGVDTSITYQFIGHTFELPHRLWCQYFSNCLEENYTIDGISTWVALPHCISLWYLKQSNFIMTMLAVPFLVLVFVFGNSLVSLITLVAIIIVTSRSRFSLRMK